MSLEEHSRPNEQSVALSRQSVTSFSPLSRPEAIFLSASCFALSPELRGTPGTGTGTGATVSALFSTTTHSIAIQPDKTNFFPVYSVG